MSPATLLRRLNLVHYDVGILLIAMAPLGPCSLQSAQATCILPLTIVYRRLVPGPQWSFRPWRLLHDSSQPVCVRRAYVAMQVAKAAITNGCHGRCARFNSTTSSWQRTAWNFLSTHQCRKRVVTSSLRRVFCSRHQLTACLSFLFCFALPPVVSRVRISLARLLWLCTNSNSCTCNLSFSSVMRTGCHVFTTRCHQHIKYYYYTCCEQDDVRT